MDSSIKEFSVRFSLFKELSETLQFILYPDVSSFDKINLPQLHGLEIEQLEIQLIGFKLSSMWIQKCIEARKKLMETVKLTSNLSKNGDFGNTLNSIPYTV
ncbi:dimer_Tnp_hAT domain-containing protein [Trichonephila clavipes]|uniref:Dimer_Tnp_hAT domain-containing protein n=1 Tax=Trichonephila clavipes TaxID=2585209 RepID=A0A8X6RWN5_TRICX|nr:dimer_Tnp_hAT domain-containing protein [Trichonephila clavipes]